MVSDFHGSVHQRGDADDMGFECSVDRTNRMNSVVSQTMLPMQRKYHIKRDSMESYYHMLMQTPLFSSLSSDELPHMLNCLQARQKSYVD